jgi:adenylate cyclase
MSVGEGAFTREPWLREASRHVASLAEACCLNPGRARSTIVRGRGGPVQSPNEQRVERRLAAIFAADVAGYSRLMSQDEAGTLRALAAAREVMDGLIRDHGGRIANTAGDSVLAEFPSAVNAVQCAVAVQEKLAEASVGDPEDWLQFRIGLHVGDVVVRAGDLLGDGVNVAARLEGLAEPGGIAISSAAHGYVRKALPLAYTDLGEQVVKNIDEPVRVYAVARAMSPAPNSGRATKPLPVPDKPSIAVLPFTNMSGDPEQDYFCDGLVEDIITALSRIRQFFVIARNSSFTYKGAPVDVRQVGRELGVRYVLEGSVRRSGQRLRIIGQLIEAETGRHIWADRFDGNLEDTFDLQDQITSSVVAALEPNLRSTEIQRAQRKPTDQLSAYDLYLRALTKSYDFNGEQFLNALSLLEQALSADPNYSDAWALKADIIGRLALGGWRSFEAAGPEGRDAALRAVEADAENAFALASAAFVFSSLHGSVTRALEFAERALRLHPNSATVLTMSAVAFNYNGEFEKARHLLEQATRINPLDPRAYINNELIGFSFFFEKRFEDAVRWCRIALDQNPRFTVALRFLAASLAHLRRDKEARTTVQALLSLQPNSSLRISRRNNFRYPWMVDLFVEGLQKAGLPE